MGALSYKASYVTYTRPFEVQALDADSCALDAECDTPAEPDETQGGFEPDSECIACACPRN